VANPTSGVVQDAAARAADDRDGLTDVDDPRGLDAAK
jgi:hypothetical protein